MIVKRLVGAQIRAVHSLAELVWSRFGGAGVILVVEAGSGVGRGVGEQSVSGKEYDNIFVSTPTSIRVQLLRTLGLPPKNIFSCVF